MNIGKDNGMTDMFPEHIVRQHESAHEYLDTLIREVTTELNRRLTQHRRNNLPKEVAIADLQWAFDTLSLNRQPY